MRTLDAHVDTLWQRSGMALHGQQNVTKDRMSFGGLDHAVFAIYISDHWQDNLGPEGTKKAVDKMYNDFWQNFPEHYLAVEGARCLGEHPERRLKELGNVVKYLTLVHNSNNIYAGSATEESTYGLTRFGRSLVRECEDLGVLIDVSHCSDKAIDDVLSFTTSRPIIASHSGCRARLHHVRNLTDLHIGQIALTDGVVCVPFARKFVGTMAGVAEHLDHICQVTGSSRHAAVGSDLDGAAMVAGVTGAENWAEVVVDGLARKGYKAADIALIAGGNILRVFGEIS